MVIDAALEELVPVPAPKAAPKPPPTGLVSPPKENPPVFEDRGEGEGEGEGAAGAVGAGAGGLGSAGAAAAMRFCDFLSMSKDGIGGLLAAGALGLASGTAATMRFWDFLSMSKDGMGGPLAAGGAGFGPVTAAIITFDLLSMSKDGTGGMLVAALAVGTTGCLAVGTTTVALGAIAAGTSSFFSTKTGGSGIRAISMGFRGSSPDNRLEDDRPRCCVCDWTTIAARSSLARSRISSARASLVLGTSFPKLIPAPPA